MLLHPHNKMAIISTLFLFTTQFTLMATASILWTDKSTKPSRCHFPHHNHVFRHRHHLPLDQCNKNKSAESSSFSSIHFLAGFVAFSKRTVKQKSPQKITSLSHTSIKSSSFTPSQKTYNQNHQMLKRKRKISNEMTMLRNIDLPECIIFYGIDTIATPNENKYNIKKGVTRLLNECQEVDTAAILLSERLHIDEMKDIASNAVNDENESGLLMEYVNNGVLHLRSSLDQTPSSSLLYTNNLNVSDGEDEEEVEEDPKYLYYNLGPIGISPNPASVIDALNSVTIQPRGFGGSSGFGTQKQDPARSPIPKHTVAFVSGLSDDGNDSNEETTTAISRGRCTACRLAGMRVLYIEDLGMGTCTAEDLADGIVETLGDENVDWDVVTLDGISTPGNYWLNPPNPRDDEGNRVNVEEVVEFFRKERRSNVVEATDNEVEEGSGGGFDSIHDEMDEEEMARILSDIDGL